MRRRFSRRPRKEMEELDITSLLDILVILLVFLLQSYNASNMKIDLVKNLSIPDSSNRVMGNQFVTIQVSKAKEIFVDNVSVATIGDEARINSLYKELKAIEEKKKEGKEDTTKLSVNLVMDAGLDYADMQKVMHTSALAGFPQFKLIVKGNY